jgi:hypothetical protein
MAVTQISRVQVRKGRKISPTGVPQLSGGEFAWVVDSQELFIGNGSVAEGAPYVGNTKVLTEHDNILALISSYKFGGSEAGSPIPFSISRSFQDKLDEYVSVFDFGAVGDGVLDNTPAFETAFEQLFQNVLTNYRKVLIVPNGDYVFDNNLRVPSHVQLVGETRDGVTLRFTGDSGIRFVNAIGGLETILEFEENIRPENIRISNLTIEGAKSVFSGSKSVMIENVTFIGDPEYVRSEPALNPRDFVPTISWNNSRLGLETTDLKFKNCRFENLDVAVRCDQSVVSETQITIDDCHFKNLDTGVMLLGVEDQSNRWKFVNSTFTDTSNHGIYISNGVDTLIRECSFKSCGVNLDGSLAVNSVYFGQSRNNILIDCLSDRQKDQTRGLTAGEIEQSGLVYIPEVFGASKVTFLNRNEVEITNEASATPFALLSAFNDYIELDYFIKLRTGDSRRGTITITVDRNSLEENEFIEIINVTDDYSYYSVPGQANARQVGTNLTVYSLEFGQVFVGSVISGTNITPGTRITFVDTFNNPPVHSVDRPPLLSESTPNQVSGAPIFFERDIIKNLTFSARILRAEDSSAIDNTIVLEYKFDPQRTAATENESRRISGTISFDVTYGTADI